MSVFKFPDSLISAIRNAEKITVLTGAGISSESGIPTFREAQTGLWENYNPEDLATPQAFQINPKLVWDWYLWRRKIILMSEPNSGHYSLAEMEHLILSKSGELTLITQNVDGLHKQAGSKLIIELHGNIMTEKCTQCNLQKAGGYDPSPEIKLPTCEQCGGLLRPNVVWFGESLPTDKLQLAWRAAENCDVFFSIGTSAIVQPAASLPRLARQNGATVVEVNPRPTPLTPYTAHYLQGFAGRILPKLIDKVWKNK